MDGDKRGGEVEVEVYDPASRSAQRLHCHRLGLPAGPRRSFTPLQQRSPLAKVPYDLRHAAVSLWLNAGVPATEVVQWAGHSVNVLLKVYTKCIDGQDEAARKRIEAALKLGAEERS